MIIKLANAKHIVYSKLISKLIDESAKNRGTGIARRSPLYIKEKILSGNSVIALDKNIILHEHVGMYAWHTKHHIEHIKMAKKNIKQKGKRVK